MNEKEMYDEETILFFLKRNAARFSGRSALEHRDAAYTWRELDELTDRAAAELIRRGVKRGECVGMQCAGALGIIAILAILKAGGAYLPLNPVFPEKRLEFMCAEAGVRTILRDSDITELTAAESGKPDCPITGTDCYAVIYTSGSTGTPKAVSMNHRDALHFALEYIKITGLNETDIVALYAGYSFVMHVTAVYECFLTGAALHILPAEIRLDIRQLERYFNTYGITDASLPVGIGKKLIGNADIPTLRTVKIGGEKLTPFESVIPGLRVFHVLGCTECAGAISVGEVFSGSGNIHVGKGTYGVTIHIVDDEANPVPDGTEGEMLVDMPGLRYKTGDLARRNPDGNIVVIGRKDFQLNVRGYRVEPSEIELCLLNYAGIAEAVAVTRGARLVVYYTADSEKSAQSMKDYLAQSLPPYMIPSVFVYMEKLPRNPNGKIDRAALPESVYVKHGGEPPQSATEQRLADLWRNVLDLKDAELFRDSSFEDLGGDSLGLVILAVEIDKAFRITVTSAELWKNGTLEKQAAMIDSVKEFSPIFAFRAEGSKPPLFFAHTGNTGPEAYVKFASLLPEELPFFSFEHRNLTLGEDLGIRDLARVYADDLRRLHPAGDYFLGGWSLGGLLSFEIALLLEQENAAPKHVYLVDPQICGEEEREIYAKLGSSPFYREYLNREPLFKHYRDSGRLERLIANNARLSQEVAQYVPQGTLHCPVTLFRATIPDVAEYAGADEQKLLARLWSLKKPDNGFGSFADNLKIINIAEPHDRLVASEASMKVIASEIINNLFECEA